MFPHKFSPPHRHRPCGEDLLRKQQGPCTRVSALETGRDGEMTLRRRRELCNAFPWSASRLEGLRRMTTFGVMVVVDARSNRDLQSSPFRAHFELISFLISPTNVTGKARNKRNFIPPSQSELNLISLDPCSSSGGMPSPPPAHRPQRISVIHLRGKTPPMRRARWALSATLGIGPK
ncbi:hypothetical protein B0H17DRAFT_1136907 [Mycena rosella]|uniref:Uncharacterized protein n=1 Tax=Mycena rosella TaxID=1033263 RepID=A0AAD7GBC4_MYCRO|nr:hypothetical protein B0H17DRAFT_1136907 [Mycena rosella]